VAASSAEVNGEGGAAGLSLARLGAYSVLQLRGLVSLPHNNSTVIIAPIRLASGTGGPVRHVGALDETLIYYTVYKPGSGPIISVSESVTSVL
jgi:hypothetical protein